MFIMTYNFFAFLSRMKHINRWGLMRNTYTENIQEHSLQVAMIAHALAVIKNKYFNGRLNADKIAVYAIYHDSNETITGDLPTPVKYFNPNISNAYKDVERLSKEKLLSMLPDDLKDVYKEILFFEKLDPEYEKLVKAADRIAAYIKCLEEEKAGNSEFKKAGEATLKKIERIDLPEVKFFIEKFLNGFTLTLDELN